MFRNSPKSLREWPKRGDKNRDGLRYKRVVRSSHGVYHRASATPKFAKILDIF